MTETFRIACWFMTSLAGSWLALRDLSSHVIGQNQAQREFESEVSGVLTSSTVTSTPAGAKDDRDTGAGQKKALRQLDCQLSFSLKSFFNSLARMRTHACVLKKIATSVSTSNHSPTNPHTNRTNNKQL